MTATARLRSYSAVAGEYYDPVRHPTCVNFREASKILIGEWLPDEFDVACDMGAGKSLLVELLVEQPSRRHGQVILIDSSEVMLRHSNHWNRRRGVASAVGDALALPFADNSLSFMVCSLGDPYNLPAFWREAGRVLEPDATMIFTTPSYEWVSRFRSGDSHQTAIFQTRHGEVGTPSYVYPSDAQRLEYMEKGTGLMMKEHAEVQAHDLSSPLSGKLRGTVSAGHPVLLGYKLYKQAS